MSFEKVCCTSLSCAVRAATERCTRTHKDAKRFSHPLEHSVVQELRMLLCFLWLGWFFRVIEGYCSVDMEPNACLGYLFNIRKADMNLGPVFRDNGQHDFA